MTQCTTVRPVSVACATASTYLDAFFVNSLLKFFFNLWSWVDERSNYLKSLRLCNFWFCWVFLDGWFAFQLRCNAKATYDSSPTKADCETARFHGPFRCRISLWEHMGFHTGNPLTWCFSCSHRSNRRLHKKYCSSYCNLKNTSNMHFYSPTAGIFWYVRLNF